MRKRGLRRPAARRQLADHDAGVPATRASSCSCALGIGHVDTAGEDRHGRALDGQRAPVRRGVDAERRSRHDRPAAVAQTGADVGGDVLAVRRARPRAHDGDRATASAAARSPSPRTHSATGRRGAEVVEAGPATRSSPGTTTRAPTLAAGPAGRRPCPGRAGGPRAQVLDPRHPWGGPGPDWPGDPRPLGAHRLGPAPPDGRRPGSASRVRVAAPDGHGPHGSGAAGPVPRPAGRRSRGRLLDAAVLQRDLHVPRHWGGRGRRGRRNVQATRSTRSTPARGEPAALQLTAPPGRCPCAPAAATRRRRAWPGHLGVDPPRRTGQPGRRAPRAATHPGRRGRGLLGVGPRSIACGARGAATGGAGGRPGRAAGRRA